MAEKESKYQVRVNLEGLGLFFLVLWSEKSFYSSLPELICKTFAIFY